MKKTVQITLVGLALLGLLAVIGPSIASAQVRFPHGDLPNMPGPRPPLGGGLDPRDLHANRWKTDSQALKWVDSMKAAEDKFMRALKTYDVICNYYGGGDSDKGSRSPQAISFWENIVQRDYHDAIRQLGEAEGRLLQLKYTDSQAKEILFGILEQVSEKYHRTFFGAPLPWPPTGSKALDSGNKSKDLRLLRYKQLEQLTAVKQGKSDKTRSSAPVLKINAKGQVVLDPVSTSKPAVRQLTIQQGERSGKVSSSPQSLPGPQPVVRHDKTQKDAHPVVTQPTPLSQPGTGATAPQPITAPRAGGAAGKR